MGANDDRSISDQFKNYVPPVAAWWKKPIIWLVGGFIVLCVLAFFFA